MRRYAISPACVASVAFLMLFPALGHAQKLKSEDVITRHLAALGAAQRRAEVRARSVEGVSQLSVLTCVGTTIAGRALMVSEGRKYRVALPFLTQDYWGEQFFSDGDKAEVGYIRAGRRSQIGSYLNTFPQIVREGLLGGVLNTAWPLLDTAGRQPKLEYDGLKRVGDRELHRITYRIRKGHGPLTIQLFFEPETFRHVRTVYEHTESAPMGRTIEESSRQSETRLRLEEEFSEFREADGLTLPTQWTVRMTAEVNQENTVLRWIVRVQKLSQNTPIDPRLFLIEPPGR